MKIDGVDHEFSTIRGVKEDVTEIILNLKKVVLKMDDDRPQNAEDRCAGRRQGEGGRSHP